MSVLALYRSITTEAQQAITPLAVLRDRIVPLETGPEAQRRADPEDPELLVHHPEEPEPEDPTVEVPTLLHGHTVEAAQHLQFPTPASYQVLTTGPNARAAYALADHEVHAT